MPRENELFDRSYQNPQLWTRLHPAVVDHYAAKASDLLTFKVSGFEDYAYQMGYLAALRWIAEEARKINREDR